MKIIIKESKGKIRKGEKQRDQEGKGHTFPAGAQYLESSIFGGSLARNAFGRGSYPEREMQCLFPSKMLVVVVVVVVVVAVAVVVNKRKVSTLMDPKFLLAKFFLNI